MHRHRFQMAGVLAALSLLAVSPSARADTADIIYSDAKNIVQEVITREAARSLVPTLVCIAPDAKVFYPRTLQRLYGLQLGNLKSSIQGETADAVAYNVFVGLNGADFVSPPREESSKASGSTAKESENANVPASTTRTGAPHETARKSVDAGGAVAASTLAANTEPVKGRAILDALQLNAELTVRAPTECKVLPSPLCDADGEVYHSINPTPKLELDKTGGRALNLILENAPQTKEFEECKAAESKNFDKGLYLNGNKVCATADSCVGNDAAELLRYYCSPNDSASRTVACELAYAVRSGIRQDASGVRHHLRRTISAFIAGELVRQGIVDASVSFSVVYEQAALILDATLETKADASEFLDKLHERLDDFHPVAKPGALNELLGDTGKLRRAIEQWRLVGEERGKESVEADQFDGFLEILTSGTGALASVCSGHTDATAKDICGLVARARKRLSGGTWSALRAAGRGQYREAAILVLRDLIKVPDECSGDSHAETETCVVRSGYRAFSEAMIGYVSDLEAGKDASVATGAAFQSAAIDLIEKLGAGEATGVERHSFLNRLVAPQFGLNYTWSGGFLNQVGADGSRFFASIDWLNLRLIHRRTQFTDFEVRLWALDVLGPFSELAMRKSGEYNDSEAVWLSFIKPKISVFLNSPIVSRHLAVGVDVGLRPIAAFGGATPGSFGYTLIYKDKTPPGMQDSVTRFLEFGVGIKYLL